jgi:hypothetical protein
VTPAPPPRAARMLICRDVAAAPMHRRLAQSRPGLRLTWPFPMAGTAYPRIVQRGSMYYQPSFRAPGAGGTEGMAGFMRLIGPRRKTSETSNCATQTASCETTISA